MLDGHILQFLHDVALPILLEHPWINGVHIQSHLRIHGFFGFYSPVIFRVPCHSKIFDIGSKFREMKIGIPGIWPAGENLSENSVMNYSPKAVRNLFFRKVIVFPVCSNGC